MTITTDRLLLEPISPEYAARVVAGEPAPGDDWHPEYPFADEVGALRSLIAHPDQDEFFTLYVVRRIADGLAVGGIGFSGPPVDGRVEIGYGLVPAARGAGIATEALRAAVDGAAAHGAALVGADTVLDNAASQRVLTKAGFVEVRRTAELVFFERALA